MKYAEVVLGKVTPKLDKIYHYSIPASLEAKVAVGAQALIPFGNRKTIGYIIGFIDKAEVKKVKDIIDITSSSPLFTAETVKLAKWLSEYYCSFFITALRAMMPPGLTTLEKKILQKPTHRNQAVQAQAKKGQERGQGEAPLTPTPHQKKALETIKRDIDQEKTTTFLLYGITGSGKTEVYLQTAEYILKKGKQAIILVPEIALTPQIIERFENRFGDHLSILHSHISVKKREEEWMKILNGTINIVLGTRSAIFAPLKNLGLIVLDEEYEFTYKQEQNPRYHAREVALKRAKNSSAVVILGSATPSVETFYHAQKGDYEFLNLPERIDKRPLPPVEIVDLRQEFGRGNKGIISHVLEKEISNSLAKKEQIILFLNRRGFFTFVSCRECGQAIECPHCTTSLIYHSRSRTLRCHLCSYKCPAPVICPQCQSTNIRFFGTGTQRIEEEVGRKFPQARILRLDTDTIRKKGALEATFKTFSAGEADILIGTQMVVKGLDIQKVTLVAALAADTALNLPDFRAAEHTFQLLTQLGGRAGRHHLPGKVIIQTYNPEHYAIQAASKHDYEGFYAQEIVPRKELNYPPFSRLINLLVYGKDEEEVAKTAKTLVKFVGSHLEEKSEVSILGPVPAVIPRQRGNWRWQAILKGKDLNKMRQAVLKSLERLFLDRVRVNIDVDPISL